MIWLAPQPAVSVKVYMGAFGASEMKSPRSLAQYRFGFRYARLVPTEPQDSLGGESRRPLVSFERPSSIPHFLECRARIDPVVLALLRSETSGDALSGEDWRRDPTCQGRSVPSAASHHGLTNRCNAACNRGANNPSAPCEYEMNPSYSATGLQLFQGGARVDPIGQALLGGESPKQRHGYVIDQVVHIQ